ncbi:MAG: hypothetical protein HC800_04785 [Phormidesmis sp. RL_2_1]|nr:hypothetical protein [Phormidesmis sp. RL_2_1]
MLPLSLQAHLDSLQPQLTAITVDPRGFKAAIQSLTDFLSAHQVRANLWLKLPKDDAWWTDIWQYGQQAAGCIFHSLGEQTGDPPSNLAASLRPIPIEQTADLKKEYLCLAVASNVVVTLFAVRTPTLDGDKRTLKLYCSTAGRTVAALSQGIKQIIENSLPSPGQKTEQVFAAQAHTGVEAGQAHGFSATSPVTLGPSVQASSTFDDPSIAAKAVLSQWQRYFPSEQLKDESLPLADDFLSWQLQFQEVLRSQLVTSRSAASDSMNPAFQTLSPDFLALAGQELQSPLTTIKAALTLLGAPTVKLAQRQLYLDMISTQCDRQQSLISSVINLLQIQTGQVAATQALQLADIIPGVVSTYQPIAEEHGIMLAYTVPPTLTAVSGVEAEIKQILIHLIKNGIAITPKGGRVWVAAMPYETDYIALTVQDSSSSLTKIDTDRLFEAFYRIPTVNGDIRTGLDLTLVQQLVKRMGGSISVNSATGKGTTFKILLPVHRSLPQADTTDNAHTQANAVSASATQASPEANPLGPISSTSTLASV